MHVLLSGPFRILQNNTEPETVPLRHKVEDSTFPCRYIRIGVYLLLSPPTVTNIISPLPHPVPLQSWGQTNFSVWYVALYGDTNPSIVRDAVQSLKEVRVYQSLACSDVIAFSYVSIVRGRLFVSV